jgi:hypothetical protein
MTEEDRLRKENLHLRCTLRAAANEIRAYIYAHIHGEVAPSTLLDHLEGRLVIDESRNPYPTFEKDVLSKKNLVAQLEIK